MAQKYELLDATTIRCNNEGNANYDVSAASMVTPLDDPHFYVKYWVGYQWLFSVFAFAALLHNFLITIAINWAVDFFPF